MKTFPSPLKTPQTTPLEVLVAKRLLQCREFFTQKLDAVTDTVQLKSIIKAVTDGLHVLHIAGMDKFSSKREPPAL